jgi:2-C-methyl-D-erythritol 4-phosphate cytidylyltransferase / 2-C-methyl-D-erythritol 2,4-cyclodiphosphate synthase
MLGAIVAAAGKGRRFGAGENKVFSLLCGRPILHWTLDALARSPEVDGILIVTGAEDRARAAEIGAAFPKVLGTCEGGAERTDSVRNALEALPPHLEWVAVHDGARPLVSAALVQSVYLAAREAGAAVPALPLTDTLKHSDDGRSTRETVDRSRLYAVQTPQVFRRALLEEAYRAARAAGAGGTDDASLVERLGHPVRLVPGERRNVKITLADDLLLAESFLMASRAASQSKPPVVRTGFGYDVHRLVPGRPLVLGGVELTHPAGLGLDGHSDADVLLHAASDALLGAAALGDIGEHFPNTDPAYRGVSSLLLLSRVGAAVRQAGWELVSLDVMLLAERPKIRPHVDAMRGRIAEALGLELDSISIKATTNEGLGFIGREEGMAAHAVATLRSAG